MVDNKESVGEIMSVSYAAPAPLFRDPVYDGAADPTVIWNHQERACPPIGTVLVLLSIGEGCVNLLH